MNTTTAAFFAAAGDLVGELLARLKHEDPEAYAALAAAIKAGGFFALGCAFGPAGPIATRLQFNAPNGERTTLFEAGPMSVEALQ